MTGQKPISGITVRLLYTLARRLQNSVVSEQSHREAEQNGVQSPQNAIWDQDPDVP